jgi:hypothetical protein
MLAEDGGKVLVDGLVDDITVVCLDDGADNCSTVCSWVEESRGGYSASSLREWETLCYITERAPSFHVSMSAAAVQQSSRFLPDSYDPTLYQR